MPRDTKTLGPVCCSNAGMSCCTLTKAAASCLGTLWSSHTHRPTQTHTNTHAHTRMHAHTHTHTSVPAQTVQGRPVQCTSGNCQSQRYTHTHLYLRRLSKGVLSGLLVRTVNHRDTHIQTQTHTYLYLRRLSKGVLSGVQVGAVNYRDAHTRMHTHTYTHTSVPAQTVQGRPVWCSSVSCRCSPCCPGQCCFRAGCQCC